jgi:hypothetical protein
MGTGPRPGDDAGGPPSDLVVHGTGLGMPGSAAPGDAIGAPKSLGAMGPGGNRTTPTGFSWVFAHVY